MVIVSKMKLQWLCFCYGLIFVYVESRELYERVGYFWHITDIHYDAHVNFHQDVRKGCWRPGYDGVGSRSQRKMGLFGDYSCDATYELIASAAQTMNTRQNDNVEFVLWTGDALLSHGTRRLSENQQLDLMQNITELLRKTFSSQFVFPALGHDDPASRRELGGMWARWLPTDSMKTFESGGYYIIERKTQKLQIVVLNTNLMRKHDNNEEEAKNQWEWLDKVLQKLKKNGETAYIVGHIPPGSDERQKSSSPSNHVLRYAEHHNKMYLKIVRKFASIIAGQFFGHLHSDTFRVMYNEKDVPISWAMLAPSITPKRTHDGPNNPGLRLYKFDKDTGQVFDYTQYYLDLSSANYNGRAEWIVEYNFSTYYGINDITPASLHALADKLTHYSDSDNSYFNRYYRANSVKINTRTQANCDETCAHTHYCAITRVDYDDHEKCLKTAASALSSSSSSRGVRSVEVRAVCAAVVSVVMRYAYNLI